MNGNIEYAYISHTGKWRNHNEDNLCCDGVCLPSEHEGTEGVIVGTADWKQIPMFGVFDGMGGESCGEIASGIAAETMSQMAQASKEEFVQQPMIFIERLCSHLNEAVLEYQKENQIRSMGSTAVMAMVNGDQVYGVNLGDSRMYHLKKSGIEQISKDQVLNTSFGKPPLLQYLGLDEKEGILEPNIVRFRPKEGDQILMCSDGLSDMLSLSEIEEILRMEQTAGSAVQRLFDRSMECGGRDNITIVLCRMPKISRISALVHRWKNA